MGRLSHCRNVFNIHQTVNHSENLIDPVTGANTQKVKSIWNLGKLKILRNDRGTFINLLQSHLDLLSFAHEF